MINIILNGKKIQTKNSYLFDLKKEFHTSNSRELNKEYVLIVNGFQTSDNLKLNDGDTVNIIEKGVMPSEDEFESMISSRHTPGVYEKLKNSKVAIAGLGGLGSNIAIMLSRIGIGNLLLVDFDVVEPSNLNRQHYLIKDLGKYKTEAIEETISQINPFINIKTKNVKVTKDNVEELFNGYDVVCEAFDKACEKAMLINTISSKLSNIKIVSGSGMAGFESSNLIKTRKAMDNLYLCGDEISEAELFNGLMAPRVSICAGHQANMVLRLLLGFDEV